MKNIELKQLGDALTLVGDLKGTKFSYAIAKNLDTIRREFKVINDTKEGKAIAEVSKKRQKALSDLMKKHEKDEDYKKAANKYIEKERKENQEVFDNYKELLEQETTVTLHKIKLSDVPNDITPNQMDSIFGIIE